jgi:opacity protein-like surface antigen
MDLLSSRIFGALLIAMTCASCLDQGGGKKHIEIGPYIIDVPSDAVLVEGRGIDSYVGKIKGKDLHLTFDYGYYSNSFGRDREDQGVATYKVDTIQGHYRRIAIAKDPMKGITGVYISDLSGFNESMNSSMVLSIGASHLTTDQQREVLNILASVRPK